MGGRTAKYLLDTDCSLYVSFPKEMNVFIYIYIYYVGLSIDIRNREYISYNLEGL